MHVKDKLWVPDTAEGHLKLELFNGDTGKLEERVEVDNYVTDLMSAWLRYQSRLYVHSMMSGIASANQDPGFMSYLSNNPTPSNPGICFALTDATSAEAPTTDRVVRGALVAFGYTAGYTGADIYRGQLNVNESSRQTNKDIFVIDWPTSAGNGTIGSAYLTMQGLNWLSYNSPIHIPLYQYIYNSINGPGPYANDSLTGLTGGTQYGLWLDPDGVSYWTMYVVAGGSPTATLVKRTLATGAQVTTIALTGMTSQAWGFTNDGVGAVGNWWVMHSSNTLYKFAAAGGAPTGTYTGKPSYGQLCFGGGYIWCNRGPNIPPTYGIIDQYLPSTGALVTSITLGAMPDATTSINGWNAGPIGYFPDAVNGDTLWIGARNSSYNGNVYNRYTLAGIGRTAFWLGQGVLGYNTWQSGSAGGIAFDANGTVYLNEYGYAGTNAPYIVVLSSTREFLSRALLPSPVTKSNTQTMKLTYEYDYA